MSMANHNWSRYELSRTRIYRPEKNLRVTLSQIMIITSSLNIFDEYKNCNTDLLPLSKHT